MGSLTVVYTSQNGAINVRSNIEYVSFSDATLSYKLLGTDGTFKIAGVVSIRVFSHGELIFNSN